MTYLNSCEYCATEFEPAFRAFPGDGEPERCPNGCSEPCEECWEPLGEDHVTCYACDAPVHVECPNGKAAAADISVSNQTGLCKLCVDAAGARRGWAA